MIDQGQVIYKSTGFQTDISLTETQVACPPRNEKQKCQKKPKIARCAVQTPKEWMVTKQEPVEVVVEIPSEETKEEEKIEEPRRPKKKKTVDKAPFKNNANHTTFGNEFITGANKPRFYNKNRC